MKKERISISDNVEDITVKMSDGNPGAMNVLINILSSNNIDPDNSLGGLAPVLLLDTLGIYGTDIYVLNNDICEGDLVKTVAVLRAVQLGFFDGKTLAHACGLQDRSGKNIIPVEELYLKVKERLPKFNS